MARPRRRAKSSPQTRYNLRLCQRNADMRAGVAQSVEQFIRNEKVEGSIPFSGTNRINDLAQP